MAIPRTLLGYTDAAEQEALIYQRNVDAALHRLLAIGLLDDLGSAGVRLHRLLAAFVHSRIPDPDQDQQWLIQTLRSLLYEINAAGIPQDGLPYLEHARQIATTTKGASTLPKLLTNLGSLLKSSGELVAARSYLEGALDIQERVLGPDHSDTAQSFNNLGNLLLEMGELATARPYLEHALDIRGRVLGPDHPNTAQSLNNLGNLLYAQGKLAAARPYLERALDIQERVLGPDHPDTTQSLNNLSNLLYTQSKLAAARPYLEHTLDIQERVPGPSHPQTSMKRANLKVLDTILNLLLSNLWLKLWRLWKQRH